MFVRFTKQRLEESRQQQIELEAANAALEVGRQELVLANEELIAQQELLDDQTQRQAQMYAVIAHELRTPAAILKMIMDSKDQEKDGVDYSLIGGLSDQLLEVLDSLRSVARPEEMLLTATRPVHLTEILQNQVELMGVIACDQGVGLASDFFRPWGWMHTDAKPTYSAVSPEPDKQCHSSFWRGSGSGFGQRA